ncbi:winged helix DNA-binding protein [Fibrobacter sp. UWB7]|uniref:winged helix DNA-binding protein n=1 Tax=Fibrobacter sp. UWB7 TaxID=1896206 RepID=UPI0009327C5F|nr:winged helix DNA-binding protein [Fibrobacter sp. UWB7]
MYFIKAIEYGSGITHFINLLHEAKQPTPQNEEISGSFLITIFATPKVADKAADKVAIKVADKVADKEFLTNAENQILKFVKTKSGCSVRDIMQKTNFSNSYVRKVLTALSQKELIEHRGSKKTGGYFSREQN